MPELPFRARQRKSRRRKLYALAAFVVALASAHAAVRLGTRIEPPSIALPVGEPAESPEDADIRVLGPAYARHRGKILEVRLDGTPEQIGHQHVRLLYPEMVTNEGTLYADFAEHVPIAPARWLLEDLARVRFRHLDRWFAEDRRREIAAQADAFHPDPYDGFLPTYHRFIFLQSLYDISLSFEHSPLLGCTSFALTGEATKDGHVLLARNFDLEAGTIFDTNKAVFLVHEAGRIPYASVAWPGFVGAVTGMNAEGLALVIHGARARHPSPDGETVGETLRNVLGQARSTVEAIAVLAAAKPLVSHIVLLADRTGDVAIVERAPGEPPFVRRGRGKVPLTNHFEGPLATDPANIAVETVTSTRPRRMRLDELLAALPNGATVEDAVRILRDKKAIGGGELPLGHRRAIDALIATHSVVMDATARVMWVSEGPHLAGRYVRFDLAQLLDASFAPRAHEPVTTLAEDPVVTSGAYVAWVRAGSPHLGEP